MGIKKKKKICKGCKAEQYLFSGGLCEKCAREAKPYKLKAKIPIKKVTEGQKQTIRQYAKVRKEYLRKNPLCKIGLPDCTRIARHIHHSGKKYSRRLWLDTALFIPCCENCHRTIENSPALAKKLGIYNYKL